MSQVQSHFVRRLASSYIYLDVEWRAYSIWCIVTTLACVILYERKLVLNTWNSVTGLVNNITNMPSGFIGLERFKQATLL